MSGSFLFPPWIIYFQILHALGLLHEHQRPDRDDYVKVDMNAAKSLGLANDFEKV